MVVYEVNIYKDTILPAERRNFFFIELSTLDDGNIATELYLE